MAMYGQFSNLLTLGGTTRYAGGAITNTGSWRIASVPCCADTWFDTMWAAVDSTIPSGQTVTIDVVVNGTAQAANLVLDNSSGTNAVYLTPTFSQVVQGDLVSFKATLSSGILVGLNICVGIGGDDDSRAE